MANAPRFTKTIVQVPIVKLANVNLAIIYAANATYDSRIVGITVSTDDAAINNLALFISDGVTDHSIGSLPIPAGSGITVSIPAVDMIAELPAVFRERDSNGVTIMNIPATFLLKAKLSALTAGKFCYVTINAELYD
jgi:hypothetical protein